MISNQVLQNTLEGLKEISRTEFCIIDTEGKLLATTFPDFEVQVTDVYKRQVRNRSSENRV